MISNNRLSYLIGVYVLTAACVGAYVGYLSGVREGSAKAQQAFLEEKCPEGSECSVCVLGVFE